MDRLRKFEKDRFSKTCALIGALFCASVGTNSYAAEEGVGGVAAQSKLTDRQSGELELACSVESEQFCSSDSISIACLTINSSRLDACCAAKVRDINGTSVQDKPFVYNGVQFPEGSSLQFDPACQHATVVTNQAIEYKGYELAAGPMVFDMDGQLGVARLVGNQQVHDLILAQDQPLTLLYDDGTPANVRVKASSDKHDIKFGPLDEPPHQYGLWKDFAKLPTKYLYQLFRPKKNAYDPGGTRLFEDGSVKRGRVVENATLKGVPVAPGVTIFTEAGGVAQGKLSGPYSYSGLKLTEGEIKFSKNGKLSEAVLAPNAILNQWKINVASEIKFQHEGLPRSLLLSVSNSDSDRHGITKVDSLWLSHSVNYSLMSNGQIESVNLAAHSWYRGKMYPGRTLMKFDENGEVIWDSFYNELLNTPEDGNRRQYLPEILPTAEVHRGTLLPAGSLLYPETRRGELRAIVPRPFDYLGLRIQAGEIWLGQNGSILKASLDGDQRIKGLLIKGFPLSIAFTDSGDVHSARLAGDQIVNGLPVKGSPYVIQFGPAGHLQKAALSQNTDIDGLTYAANKTIELEESGRIEAGTIASPTLINDILLPEGSRLEFDREGNLSRCELSELTTIAEVEIPAKSQVKFIRGNLLWVSSKESITVENNTYSGDNLTLRKDGSVANGMLMSDAIIDGQSLKAGTKVKLSADGKLRDHFFVGVPYDISNAKVMVLSSPETPVDVAIDLNESTCLHVLNSQGGGHEFSLGKSLMPECVHYLTQLGD